CLLSFFFSSRRRHTRSKRDWSSDVCSSDLVDGHDVFDELVLVVAIAAAAASTAFAASAALAALSTLAAATGGAVTAVVVASLSSRLLFLVLFSAHRANPPSRAPSAIACTRPW